MMHGLHHFPRVAREDKRTPRDYSAPMLTVKDRVRRGAQFLDQKYADSPVPWWDRIDLKFLCLSSNSQCVLGQLEGSYTRGLIRNGITSRFRDGRALGFNARWVGIFEFPMLTTAWKMEIEQRRHQATIDALEKLIEDCRIERIRLLDERKQLLTQQYELAA